MLKHIFMLIIYFFNIFYAEQIIYFEIALFILNSDVLIIIFAVFAIFLFHYSNLVIYYFIPFAMPLIIMGFVIIVSLILIIILILILLQFIF
jgi:hypothetical protein